IHCQSCCRHSWRTIDAEIELKTLIAIRGPVTFPNGLPDLRRKTRAFFSRLAQGASAKTVCTIRRARSDTGKITEKCSRCRRIARALTQGGIAGWIVERKAHPAKIGEGCKLRITEPHWPDAMIAGGQMRCDARRNLPVCASVIDKWQP